MAKFTHKDIEIEFDDNLGCFRANLGGKPVTASSLDAMRKKISAFRDDTFEPFIALRHRRYEDPRGSPELIEVKIVRKDKDGRGRSETGGFIDEKGTKYRHRALLPNTQEARDLYAASQLADRECDAAERERRETREAIPYIKFEND